MHFSKITMLHQRRLSTFVKSREPLQIGEPNTLNKRGLHRLRSCWRAKFESPMSTLSRCAVLIFNAEPHCRAAALCIRQQLPFFSNEPASFYCTLCPAD